MTNLFSALHKYHPRPDRSPRENQVTEMLGQVFKHEPGFAREVLKKWFEVDVPPDAIETRTQVSVPGGGATKYVDLLLEDQREETYGRPLLLGEIKWGTGEHWSWDQGVGTWKPQTDFYERWLGDTFHEEAEGIARLYLTPDDTEVPEAWKGKGKAKRWADLHRLAVAYRKAHRSKDGFGLALLGEFIAFLKEEGMAADRLELTDLPHLAPAVDVFHKVTELLSRVATDLVEPYRKLSRRAPYETVATQIFKNQRFGLWFRDEAGLSYCAAIYPRGDVFNEEFCADAPEDLGVVTVWIEAYLDSLLQRKARGTSVIAELVEKRPHWKKVEAEGYWPIVYTARSLLDLPGQGDFADRLEGFFRNAFQDLVDLDVYERLRKECEA